jgi:hypothetical protein
VDIEDYNKASGELILYEMKDFIDLFSQMNILRIAINEGKTEVKDAIGHTFSCFMTICEKRLE